MIGIGGIIHVPMLNNEYVYVDSLAVFTSCGHRNNCSCVLGIWKVRGG